jgi:hypothetical protein
VAERGNVTAFRCTLDGRADRCLAVPACMFEHKACAPLALAPRPRVAVGALSVLWRLLVEALSCARMDASASAAEGDSPDQNRGGVDATRLRPPSTDPGEPVPASDLFAAPPAASGPGTAVWRALPEETRQSLVGLLPRLLLDHGSAARRAGGRHDR